MLVDWGPRYNLRLCLSPSSSNTRHPGVYICFHYKLYNARHLLAIDVTDTIPIKSITCLTHMWRFCDRTSCRLGFSMQ